MCAIIGAIFHDLTTQTKINRALSILNHIESKSRERGRDGYGRELYYLSANEYLFPENHPLYTLQKIKRITPQHGRGLQIFKNGVDYVK